MEHCDDRPDDGLRADGQPEVVEREHVRNGNHGDGLNAHLPSELALRLRELGRYVSPDQISDVWIFPPLPDMEGSAEFLLFTRYLPDEMRRLCAAELGSKPNGNGNAGSGDDGAGKATGVAADHGNGTAPRPVANGGNANGTAGSTITEFGAVPSHRLPRLLAGFRKRLGDVREPLHFEVGGCPLSWDRLVTPIGEPDTRV